MPKQCLIALPEGGSSESAFRAAAFCAARGWLVPVIFGRREDFATAAEALGIPFRGVQVVYPTDHPWLEEAVEHLAGRSPRRLTGDHWRAELMGDPLRFALALMMVGRIHGVVIGSATGEAEIQDALVHLMGGESAPAAIPWPENAEKMIKGFPDMDALEKAVTASALIDTPDGPIGMAPNGSEAAQIASTAALAAGRSAARA